MTQTNPQFRQAVRIGHNITDIMRLPCVYSCHKRTSWRGGTAQPEYYYILWPSQMADPDVWQYAHPGD